MRRHQATHPRTYVSRLYTPSYVCTKIIHTRLRMHQDYTHPLTYAPRLYTPTYVCTKIITPSYVYASRQHALLHMRQYNNPLTHASIQHIPFPIHMHQDEIHPLTYASTAHTKTTYTLLRMHQDKHLPLPPHNNTLLRTHQDNTPSYICVKITHTLRLLCMHQDTV